ncbi:unnamed protein product [Ilex paraguariensis]
MSPEELQKMFEITSSLKEKVSGSAAAASLHSNGPKALETQGNFVVNGDSFVESNSQGFLNSRSAPQSSLPRSSSDLQEKLSNEMKDPAMQQVFLSMIKNMSPDMMANMSEQFGFKLLREDAEKAQQVMSPGDLDRMMKWADRIQRRLEVARQNWLLGRAGMILAVCMLILAVIHWLGFIGR